MRKISRIGNSKGALREMDQIQKDKIINNVMAMIPENVKAKLNSKYKGAVEENLSSKIQIGKQVKFLLHIRYFLRLLYSGKT